MFSGDEKKTSNTKWFKHATQKFDILEIPENLAARFQSIASS